MGEKSKTSFALLLPGFRVNNWPQVALEELVRVNSPITYGVVQPGRVDPAGVLFVRGGDIEEGRILIDQLRTITLDVSAKYTRTVLRGGELLISLVGNPGAVAMVPQALAGSNIARQVALLRFGDRVDTEFVKYYLQSPLGQEALRVEVLGSVQQVINLKELRKLRVPVPPLGEQRAICRILGAIDEKIEVNRQMNRTLEAIAETLFKSWFVDFDPVVAKAAEQQPFGMEAGIAALFPDRFSETQLGSIPAQWQCSKLGDVIQINGRTVRKDHLHYAIEYIDISAVSPGRLDSTTIYESRTAPGRARRLVADGDTIWSCVRPNRRSYLYIDEPTENLVVSTGFAVLSPKGLPPGFLYQLVTTDAFVDYLTANAEGSAYPAVRPDVFARADLVVPEKPVLEAFERLVRPLRKRIAQNDRESRVLAMTQNALLPELLSGEIQLGHAEKLVGHAV